MSSIDELKHLQIPLYVISLATNEFAKENYIGWGGFGHVYKGESEKHGKIAVKRLERVLGQGDREFKTEIALLSVYKHENIVSLYGYCDEDGEKILVYKLESRGSLDKYLYSKDLNWIQRIRICIDACNGLRYLHDDVGPQHRIIHRDIKSSNILLDENWKAKISDFGLSKIGLANVRHTFLITNTCGTIGYIDPEYLDTAVLTKESDVYSFGVVLFEVMCGRAAHFKDEGRMLYMLAQKHFETETLDEIIHPELRKEINDASLTTFSTIAYQCLKKRRKERPTMKKIMEQLQKALKDQLAPSRSSSGVYYSFSDEDNDDFGVYDGYSDQKSDDFDALHQGQFSFPINDLGFLKSDIKTSKTSTKPRLVRCPRCSCILREPKDVFKYQCGGCGAILQAKIEKDDTIDTTSQMRTKPQFVRCSRCESVLPEPKDGVLVYQCGGCYATLEAKNEKDSMIDTTSQMSTKPRLVRCPRCESVLREPKDVCMYQCGGCGAKLQAKIEKE